MSHKTAATVVHTIGIDTGKNTLHLIGLDDQGAIVLREKIARGRIAARLANVPRCLIGIEAGMATHYVARELGALGHDVKQVPPAYSKPFRNRYLRMLFVQGARAVSLNIRSISTASSRRLFFPIARRQSLRSLMPWARRFCYARLMQDFAGSTAWCCWRQ